MPLSFSNLPLSEVSVRLFFNPHLEFGFENLVNAMDELKERYPHVEHTTEFELPPAAARPQGLQLAPGKMMAVTFSNPETGMSVSLQPFVVSSAWTRLSPSNTYCRFDPLCEGVWLAYSAIMNALASNSLPRVPVVANVCYTNVIDDASCPDIISAYFSSLVNVKPWTADPAVVHTLNLVWSHQNGIESRIELIKRAPHLGGYALKTVAGRFIRDASIKDAHDALAEIHDSLLAMFEAIISEEAKVKWRLERT